MEYLGESVKHPLIFHVMSIPRKLDTAEGVPANLFDPLYLCGITGLRPSADINLLSIGRKENASSCLDALLEIAFLRLKMYIPKNIHALTQLRSTH